jgi:hypothetical protein
MLRQQHRADRNAGRHCAHAGIDDAVADRRHEAAGNRLDPFLAAILQHNAELVRRKPADAISEARAPGNPVLGFTSLL